LNPSRTLAKLYKYPLKNEERGERVKTMEKHTMKRS
jgi:hypothetical protein